MSPAKKKSGGAKSSGTSKRAASASAKSKTSSKTANSKKPTTAENAELDVAAVVSGTVGEVPYAELMSENYLLFAVSTLLGRALPYIDGLKPVQRRILHSMHQSGLYYDRGTVKSALIVGEVMGKYHPHGDSSIYEALVRMSQDFSMRLPLIDGQGNFGNIDGDAAAAMRYTEARLTKAAGQIVADSHPEIVDRYMGRNYTEDLPEPGLLPARFPNLLINGSTGIATGMTSVFLPHNPEEAMNLCIWRLEHPEASPEEVVARISGPDFPTGAAVLKDQGLEDAYLTGKGRVTGVCQAHIEPLSGNREKVVITEIPWMVDKGKLLMDITRQYEKGDYPELTDLVDYSDKEIRIEAPLKRNVNAQAFLAKLMNNTALRRTYPVEMNVVIDGVPKTVTLTELIDHFLDFRREMVVNRAKKRIAEIEGRLYKLEAYLKVISAVDKVVAIIKKAKDRQAAKAPLQKLLKIDEQQAQWIVEMALGSLTQLDSQKIKDEAGELKKELAHWQKFINDQGMVTAAMSEEFSELLADWKKSGLTERKTALLEPSSAPSAGADSGSGGDDGAGSEPLVTTVAADDQEVLLLISENGRAACSTGSAKRGAALKLKDDDRLAVFAAANTNQEWLVFTDRGRVFRLRLAELPLESRKTAGMALDQLINIEEGEKVISAQQAVADSSYLTVTAAGMVKRSAWSEIEKAHSGGVLAAKIAADDRLIAVADVGDDDQICLVANNGKALRFPAAAARVMGRNAAGVRGIKLGPEEQVVGVAVFAKDSAGQQLLVTTDRGFAKRLAAEEIPSKGRGGQGVMVAKPGGKYGLPATAALVSDQWQVVAENGGGQTSALGAKEIALVGRAIVVKSWPAGAAQRVFVLEA